MAIKLSEPAGAYDVQNMQSQGTYNTMPKDEDKIHFMVMAIESSAELMGITPCEMRRRLECVGLLHSLLWDCYVTMHAESLAHVAEDVVTAPTIGRRNNKFSFQRGS